MARKSREVTELPWQVETSSHPTCFHAEAVYRTRSVQDNDGFLFGSVDPSANEASGNKSVKMSAKKVCGVFLLLS